MQLSRDFVQKDRDFNDTQSSFQRIGHQESPSLPAQVILLLDEVRDFPGTLVVVGLDTEVEEVSGKAGAAGFTKCSARHGFSLSVHVVDVVDQVVEALVFDVSF